MEGLLSFLLFAVIFYVMMRYGCGAHMLHGHSSNAPDTDHIDPVCHVKVDPSKGYGLVHHDKLYRFCSRSCLDEFESDPEKYVALSLKEMKNE